MSVGQSSRTAVITGANGGIGGALCVAFRLARYRVIGCDVKAGRPDCDVFCQFDVRDLCGTPSARDEILGRIRSALGQTGLTALVNNAAVQILGAADELTAEEWHETLDTNLLAPFLLTQGLLPELERAHGSVINISSIHAELTKPGFVAYATSKAGLVALTHSLAVDLGGRVRVNAITPAATTTPMLLAAFEGRRAELERLGAMHPLGRVARPEEVAAAAVFLASEAAEFLTGVALPVDGGMACRLHDPV